MTSAAVACNVLEEMRRLDPLGTQTLFDFKIPCVPNMCEHPTLMVDQDWNLGILGVINGILLEGGSNAVVCATYSDDGQLIRFSMKCLT